MRRHGYLFEQVVTWENLLAATRKAGRGKRSQPCVAQFLFHLEDELLGLQCQLRDGTWRPGPFRTFSIRDPKPRLISAAPFRDRVVHHALMAVLDPIFEASLITHTFACRRGKGTHKAIAYARNLARSHRCFLKADVEAYFESVPHDRLQKLLRRKLKDHRVLRLLDQIIASGGENGRGLPIGNLTSQYFANHYLGQLDHFVKSQLRVRPYLRYMDDLLLFSDCLEMLHRQRAEIRWYLRDELGLKLKERASFVAPTSSGVPFLGFAIFPGMTRLQGARARRMRRRIKMAEAQLQAGNIDVESLARSVQSSVAHAAHGNTIGLRRRWFEHSAGH